MKRGIGKYILIYDTGDMVFTNKKEALKFASYLRSKGRRVDRLQTYHGMNAQKPVIIKKW